MRGDRPSTVSRLHRLTAFTPHARGSTLQAGAVTTVKLVYPACAGIDLSVKLSAMGLPCLPRMRGDRPYNWEIDVLTKEFTPHARGSTLIQKLV